MPGRRDFVPRIQPDFMYPRHARRPPGAAAHVSGARTGSQPYLRRPAGRRGAGLCGGQCRTTRHRHCLAGGRAGGRTDARGTGPDPKELAQAAPRPHRSPLESPSPLGRAELPPQGVRSGHASCRGAVAAAGDEVDPAPPRAPLGPRRTADGPRLPDLGVVPAARHGRADTDRGYDSAEDRRRLRPVVALPEVLERTPLRTPVLVVSLA